jgi:hypothetical protein
MYPHTDQPLRDMPLTTKDEAIAYLTAYKNWLYANGATGNGAFIGAKSKPASVRAPDLFQKAVKAEEMAEMNYWQMPFEKAQKVHYGIPYKKWESARIERGLPVGEIANQL